MKAEERHGLKTNELAEWIFNLPQAIKENLQMIIYVTATVILLGAAAFYYLYQKKIAAAIKEESLTSAITSLSQSKMQILQMQTQGLDLSYNLIQMADELEAESQKQIKVDAAALGLIKRAEALRMELHYRPGTVNREALTGQVNLAKESYEKAIEKAAANPLLTAKAKFGLGLCEEELGNFAAAAQIYQQIAQDEKFDAAIGSAEAKYRLVIMADYQQPVTFKPAPQPLLPAEAPAIPPVPEVNIPQLPTIPELTPAETEQK